MNRELIKRILKKASQSNCRFKVAAIGLNNRGEVVYSATNKIRFSYKGGGIHAEMLVMLKSPRSLKTILLCRIGNRQNIRPIEPCEICKKKAEELKIKIIPITGSYKC